MLRTKQEQAIDSFCDQLRSSIDFAIGRSRDLLRRLLKEHVTDDTRQQLAKRVVEHLELSGFEIDEPGQAIRKRPRSPPLQGKQERLSVQSPPCDRTVKIAAGLPRRS